MLHEKVQFLSFHPTINTITPPYFSFTSLKVIEDGRLFLLVGALLLLDVFTLSLWTALDTQTRTLHNGTVEVKAPTQQNNW